ncbi:MAG TPA: hypothetical protein VN638_12680 [Nitrospiraceae bacterium]|nr:hypothetical protein [Nitrospiraceae bacterium]
MQLFDWSHRVVGPQRMSLSDATEPRRRHFFLQYLRSLRLLVHPMFLDEGVYNIATGYTSPTFHPHWNAALLDVDQVIGDHEAVTFSTVHGTLLLFTVKPLPTSHLSVADVYPGRITRIM